ncbi:MAG: LacI family DNA-binding transcriptional regulator [Actinomycetota bacterium]
MSRGQRPTLRDVARESGLSITQTSRALNGHEDVAAGTRERALEAAHRLGYVPNQEARRLRDPNVRSHSLGLVLVAGSQRFSDPFFGELLAAIVDEAASRGYELQLSTPLADEDPVASYERAIRAKRVDGFVLLRTALSDPRVDYLVEEGVPFVTFGEVPGPGRRLSVSEASDCIQPAVDHLVALGHRQIGCLTEPLEYVIAARRFESFKQALAHHGIEARADHIVPSGFREDSAVAAMGQLLASNDPPTALVAFNDLVAFGAMRAAAQHGIDVPHELSIVGFDDVYASRLSSPPLTTLRLGERAIGRELVTQLVAAIEDPDSATDVHLTPELVIRESTAVPPTR